MAIIFVIVFSASACHAEQASPDQQPAAVSTAEQFAVAARDGDIARLLALSDLPLLMAEDSYRMDYDESTDSVRFELETVHVTNVETKSDQLAVLNDVIESPLDLEEGQVGGEERSEIVDRVTKRLDLNRELEFSVFVTEVGDLAHYMVLGVDSKVDKVVLIYRD